ncbi:hypothetical protein [Hymenobacter rubidus]|uniref:hypothetical protein n=1 Tax=Hymenobacter rubidus TaxID=1441626 RepID=UPI00191EB089|nr:hypothetical protein [Hymenobacter rubidus]
MATFHSLKYVFIGCVLLGSSACTKDELEDNGLSNVDGVPYYHFTDKDRLWLQVHQGDEWRMVNQQGYQRVYRAGIIEDIKGASHSYSGGIPGSSKLLNYYDQVTVRLSRTDSAKGGADLRFYRAAAMLTNLSSGGYATNVSRFYAEGEWYDFAGNTDLISDYYSCRGLKFPSNTQLNGPFQQLTVRGRQYGEVVAFIASDRGPTCAPVSASFMRELYYDRQAGLVRMVSLAGEVWERMP